MASAQRAGMLPTNRPDVWAFPAPPTNFDPNDASDEELRSFGFPPKPNDAQRLDTWRMVTSSAGQRIVPQFGKSTLQHRPAQKVQAASNLTVKNYAGETVNPITQSSSNWSGFALSSSNGTFSSLVGVWAIPSVTLPPGASCSGSTPGYFSSDWDGIDGFSNTQLVQAGTEGDVLCSNGSASLNYHAWFEWLPNAETPISNFTVEPGDGMAVEITVVNSTTADFFIVDFTTGQNTSFQATAPAGASVEGASVEWIHEATTVVSGGVATIATLPAYGNAFFTGTWANLTSPNNINVSKGAAVTPGFPGSASLNTITLVQNNTRSSFPRLMGPAIGWLVYQTEESTLFGD
jgi:hypothetical protein